MKNKQWTEVRVGQLWRDMDKRMPNRVLVVVAIEGDKAVMRHPRDIGIPATSVLIRRMQPSGRLWVLVEPK